MKCKLFVSELLCAAMLLGCSSAPKLSLPTGDWEEVNQPGALNSYKAAVPNFQSAYPAPAPVVSVPPPPAPIAIGSTALPPGGAVSTAAQALPPKGTNAVVAVPPKLGAPPIQPVSAQATKATSIHPASQVAPISVAPLKLIPAAPVAAVTTVRPVPVPTPPKPPLPTWTAAVGSTLHQTVAEWCKRAGVRLIWNQEDLDYPIEAPLSFKGTFPEAIDQIFPLYDGAKRSFLVDGNTSSQGILYVSERKK